MTQITPDLWPADFGSVKVRLPVVILREQAALLGKKTSNLVQAEVRPEDARELGADLEHRFSLVVPALDNYRYFLFSVAHNAGDIYPVRFFPPHSEGEFEELGSEQRLMQKLADVFNADETRRVVESLMAQSQAA